MSQNRPPSKKDGKRGGHNNYGRKQNNRTTRNRKSQHRVESACSLNTLTPHQLLIEAGLKLQREKAVLEAEALALSVTRADAAVSSLAAASSSSSGSLALPNCGTSVLISEGLLQIRNKRFRYHDGTQRYYKCAPGNKSLTYKDDLHHVTYGATSAAVGMEHRRRGKKNTEPEYAMNNLISRSWFGNGDLIQASRRTGWLGWCQPVVSDKYLVWGMQKKPLTRSRPPMISDNHEEKIVDLDVHPIHGVVEVSTNGFAMHKYGLTCNFSQQFMRPVDTISWINNAHIPVFAIANSCAGSNPHAPRVVYVRPPPPYATATAVVEETSYTSLNFTEGSPVDQTRYRSSRITCLSSNLDGSTLHIGGEYGVYSENIVNRRVTYAHVFQGCAVTCFSEQTATAVGSSDHVKFVGLRNGTVMIWDDREGGSHHCPAGSNVVGKMQFCVDHIASVSLQKSGSNSVVVQDGTGIVALFDIRKSSSMTFMMGHGHGRGGGGEVMKVCDGDFSTVHLAKRRFWVSDDGRRIVAPTCTAGDAAAAAAHGNIAAAANKLESSLSVLSLQSPLTELARVCLDDDDDDNCMVSQAQSGGGGATRMTSADATDTTWQVDLTSSAFSDRFSSIYSQRFPSAGGVMSAGRGNADTARNTRRPNKTRVLIGSTTGSGTGTTSSSEYERFSGLVALLHAQRSGAHRNRNSSADDCLYSFV